MNNTRELIKAQFEKITDREPYETLFVGCYEELKSALNKVRCACVVGDHHTAFLRSALIQEELARFLAKSENG